MGFAMAYVGYILVIYWVGARLTGFKVSEPVLRVLLSSTAVLAFVFFSRQIPSPVLAPVVGGIATLACGLACLRLLCHRLGPDHKIARVAARIPGLRSML